MLMRAKTGMYKSLTDACVENNTFKFWIEIPLALGTVGGITNLHPLVKWSLELLKNPDAKELMKIVAVAGLAQNFGALDSLITTGIQKGTYENASDKYFKFLKCFRE